MNNKLKTKPQTEDQQALAKGKKFTPPPQKIIAVSECGSRIEFEGKTGEGIFLQPYGIGKRKDSKDKTLISYYTTTKFSFIITGNVCIFTTCESGIVSSAAIDEVFTGKKRLLSCEPTNILLNEIGDFLATQGIFIETFDYVEKTI